MTEIGKTGSPGDDMDKGAFGLPPAAEMQGVFYSPRQASKLERIIATEREAFSAEAGTPNLESPDTDIHVVRFDTAMLSKHLPFYRESIWDDYLEGLTEAAEEARKRARVADEEDDRVRDAAIEAELAREAFWAVEAAQAMVNLAMFAALFNPLHPEIKVVRSASDLLMAKEMNASVVMFLDDSERMEHLRSAMAKHVEQLRPEASPEQQQAMVQSLFLQQRVAMAFTGLVTYQAVLSQGQNWSLDSKSILTGSFDGIGERLQKIFAIDYAELATVMGSRELDEWLKQIAQLIRPRAQSGMNTLYAFLEKVVHEVENRDPKA